MAQRKVRRLLAFAALTSLVTIIPMKSAYAEEMEEVIVTGSFIKGTPEDAALPVEVISAQDLENAGNPTILEMIRNLGVTSGNIGETNQFTAGPNEGVQNVNLRGLGAARTLVLINGKRHVATETIGVDISAIPTIAIGRLEILKDGAAAVYGSDAIAGVSNFITRSDYEGLEIRGSHQNIEQSDGDNSVSVLFGRSFENIHFMVAAEHQTRGELRIRDRDWALQSFADNPEGGWSGIGNPASFFGLSAAGGFVTGRTADPNCNLLGSFNDNETCRFQYTAFDNLIEEQDTSKVFAEMNIDVNDNMRFHAEYLYHESNIDAWKTSPSYPPQSFVGPDRTIPANNPGFIDFKLQNPTFIPTSTQAAWVGRMLGSGGRFGEPEEGVRLTDTNRLAASLEGEFGNGISYDVGFNWSERERTISGSDMYTERLGLALDGFGGPACDFEAAVAAGTPGVGGCEFYNPFSNAIQESAINGAVNPQYNAAVANSRGLIDWLTARTGSVATNELTVFDAVFSGQTNWELGGGTVGWAAGVQSRQDEYTLELEDIANRAVNPCTFINPASQTLGHWDGTSCASFGRLAFLAATDERSTKRDVAAIFAEFALPLTDTLDIQLAGRYEDYGDDGGDTFDPKLALSWALTDAFKLRGSASTTFRGAPTSFQGGVNTSLGFIAPTGSFKAIDTTGNPNLVPESAVALNLGLVYADENFYGSIDYWSFDFDDAFQTENATQIATAIAGALCGDGEAGALTPATITPECAQLRVRVEPAGTNAAGIERIKVNVINGSNRKTTGFDFVARYTFNDVAGGDLTIGTQGTYLSEFTTDDFVSIEGFTLAAGGDFAGQLNDTNVPFTPKPELQGNLNLSWSNDEHRVGYTYRYISDYEDIQVRGSATKGHLADIDSHGTHDINYVNNMFDNTTIILSITNAADEDPPSTSTDLGYDAFTHNPFGRMIKLGVTYTPTFLN